MTLHGLRQDTARRYRKCLDNMPYTLDGLTLPRPHGFNRDTIEYSTRHDTLSGRTTKDMRSRKERFVLFFKHLTQTEIGNILAKRDLDTVLSFSVSDGSLTISATDVHVEVDRREYNTPGTEYREDIVLTLTEEV